jgi:hypothetical protein
MHSLREEDLADLHLVTGDLPAGEMRIGQMPTWLDRNKSCSTHLQVHHHWDIFKMRIRNVLEPEAKVWRENILPTFNSIAIESQLVTLAPQLTDTALYVCVVSPFLFISYNMFIPIFHSSTTISSLLGILLAATSPRRFLVPFSACKITFAYLHRPKELRGPIRTGSGPRWNTQIGSLIRDLEPASDLTWRTS